VIGDYILSVSTGSIDENIALTNDYQLSYSIAITIGLVALTGGVLSLLSLITKGKGLS